MLPFNTPSAKIATRTAKNLLGITDEYHFYDLSRGFCLSGRSRREHAHCSFAVGTFGALFGVWPKTRKIMFRSGEFTKRILERATGVEPVE
jgi:hypothetical protein